MIATRNLNNLLPISIAASFTTSKIWNELKYPLSDEWKGRGKHDIYLQCNYYSAFKKKEVLPLYDNISEPKMHYAKCNQPVRKTYILHDSTGMQYLLVEP